MANQNANTTRVTTDKVRLSYTHLFQPYASHPGQEAKYSTTMLIPKSDIRTKQAIDNAIANAVNLGVSAKWNGARPANPKTPLWDGDGVRQNGEAFGEECKGHWVMTASSKLQPQVVDAQIQPILDQTQVYSGMYARVSLNFFAYNNNGNRGIGCGLGNVQKIADGEPLGGRTSAEDDFGSLPPVQGVQQQPYQAPVQQQPVQAIDPITGLPIV